MARAGSRPSSISVPGVMTRTTSRWTRPLAGTSPIWSQIGDPVALLDQPRDVPFGGVVRHAGHRHPLAAADVAAGEHDVERLRHDLGVVVERLVEVAQAEEEDRVRMARLHLKVLPTNRRRRQVLGAKQRELIEVALAHVGGGAGRRGTAGPRRRGGQYSTLVGSSDARRLLEEAG